MAFVTQLVFGSMTGYADVVLFIYNATGLSRERKKKKNSRDMEAGILTASFSLASSNALFMMAECLERGCVYMTYAA